MLISEGSGDWRQPFIAYLDNGVLPDDKTEATRVVRKSSRYITLNQELYRRSYSYVLLRCITREEGQYVIQEIHEGNCGSHQASSTIIRKAKLLGYFWPTMKEDAASYVQTCHQCQIHGEKSHVPHAPQKSLMTGWPFSTWGIDIAGPMPEAVWKKKFVIVAIDHFSKWVEAIAVSTITPEKVIDFVWDHIVTRYGVPNDIISDNGSQFTSEKFRKFCEGLKIRNRFSSVAHPQTNGQTERMNKTLGDGLRKRLTEKKGAWPEELNNILWSYRTTPCRPTGETPFSLVYGVEAVVPVEIGAPSDRVKYYSEAENNINLRHHLDSLEERKDKAYVLMAAYKARIAKYHDKKVREVRLEEGDLVLRDAAASQSREGKGKLGANWEGPYKVIQAVGPATYRLSKMDGKELPRTWNIASLRKYYQVNP